MDQELLIKTIIAAVKQSAQPEIKIPVGVSNRHVHLSQEDVERLFGQGATLHPDRPLSQDGFYAAKETVLVAGPRGAIAKVRVLGPVRKYTQVELLRSDSRQIGIQVPLRLSGARAPSQPVTIVGPKGTIVEDQGVIIAWRHIHISPEDAAKYGLKDGDAVKVRCGGERGLLLDQVIIRIGEGFQPELHIDVDEANAAELKNGDLVTLVY